MRRFWLLLVFLMVLAPAGTSLAQSVNPDDVPPPSQVVIAGTLQPALGCGGEWNTDCAESALAYDANSDVWRNRWVLPAGEYEYKVALNGTWDANYGRFAEWFGENIPLELEEETRVTFIYDHKTGYITDNVNSIIANVSGDFQSEIGCLDDWQPACLRSLLEDPDEDGVYTFVTTLIPAGSYNAKVAVNESWDENYGAEGASNGSDIPFDVPENAQVTFTWDSDSKAVTIETADAPEGSPTEPYVYSGPVAHINPDVVTIPGTIQSQLGCSGDWQPDCSATFLTLDDEDDVWQGEFDLVAGSYEYKVAIEETWDENYGLNAAPGGANIPLELAEGQTVKFYYDDKTNWVTDNVNSPIITIVGDFQSEIGCAEDNDAGCLRSWVQDPDGDGIYQLLTGLIPAGTYTAQAVLNENAENTLTDPIEFTTETDVELFITFDGGTNDLTISTDGAPKGNLAEFTAHWLTRETMAWDVEADSYKLHYATNAGLQIEPTGLGGEAIDLVVDPAGLPSEVQAKFPHLADLTALTIANEDDLRQVRIALKGQVAIAAYNESGNVIDATSLQIPGVIDDIYTTDAPLGVTYDGDVPTLSVWAPTARAVRLHRFADSIIEASEIDVMRIDPNTGVWSLTGTPEWTGQFYLYEIEVYVPAERTVTTNLVTDPYSISLAMNSSRSQIVDFRDVSLMPSDWNDLAKPALDAPEDIILYELHVRDFSSYDLTVPEELRGTFMAFTVADSNGMNHLRSLSQAGLTHIHLLPVFDIATIDEDKSTWQTLDFAELAGLPPDSEAQQEQVEAIRGSDAFNWGYDPFHYNVPEGSYATDPDGSTRVLEFRSMVQALNNEGLRVVMDVVYNHTNASGQTDKSVLDRVVPGYYHRLSSTGRVETSTCCQNTATEHNMMRRLMVDSVVMWATAYKVDGFRFDLMGHHMVEDMRAVRSALDSLTLEEHGVDGASIYVYGEGWNFGEVENGVRGENATQLNVGGLGIGTFNDRVRDSARGGSPFGGYTEQGFITGLYTDPNETEVRPEGVQAATVKLFADRIRIALAGNLANYPLFNYADENVVGADVDYNGSPTGYTLDPQEHIVYVSAHDNETLFDAVQYKAPAGTSMEDRVRMQNMGLSLVAFSQGVPFFHAGSDTLRSKSFDRDSFDSSDWFNWLDYTYEDNGWGRGLPPASKNRENWPLMQPFLSRPELQPSQEHILANHNHFLEILQIRSGSPLFRLQTSEDVIARVQFHNTGTEQLAGVIVMSLSDVIDGFDNLDENYDMMVVVFNSTPDTQEIALSAFAGAEFELHPVLAGSQDAIVQESVVADGMATVPGRTTAVFVVAEGTLPSTELAEESETAEEATSNEPVVEETGEETEEPEPQPTQASEPTSEAEEEPTNNTNSALIAGGAVILLGGAAFALWRRR